MREEFFLLEMNTRLQVEHPTTELVTGIDFVEWQLRVAAGEPLPERLGTEVPDGAAIEVRVCAERPAQGFAPAIGTVRRFAVPPGVRVDAGIANGTTVGADYDSMLAKIVAHGRDREQARRKLVAALDGTVLTGLDSNLDFLRAVVASDAFRDAKLSTRFLSTSLLGERSDAKRPGEGQTDLVFAAVARVRFLERANAKRGGAPWDRLGPWRLTRRAGRGSATTVELREEGEEAVTVSVGGSRGFYRIDSPSPGCFAAHLSPKARGGGEMRLEIAGAQHRRYVDIAEREVWVSGGGRHRRFAVVTREERAHRREASAADDPRNLAAPFPGLVTEVSVASRDHVDAGRAVVVMEAMKMVHHLRASGAGVVCAVHCKPGQTVAMGALLVEMEALAAEAKEKSP